MYRRGRSLSADNKLRKRPFIEHLQIYFTPFTRCALHAAHVGLCGLTALSCTRRRHLLPCHDGVVDIFFLRRMDAHEGLNRLDHALGVANEITVDLLRWQVLDDTSKQACEV